VKRLDIRDKIKELSECAEELEKLVIRIISLAGWIMLLIKIIK